MTDNAPRIALTRTVAPIRTQVADLLRTMIADGTYPPGERLVERSLCEMVGASRSTLREALRELETEGLVTVVAGKGPTVARVDEKDIRDLFQVRESLEQLAISLFLRHATDESVAELESSFEVLKEAHVKADAGLILQEKQSFYRTLFSTADNRVISDIAEKLYARTNSVRLLSYSRKGRIAEGLSELELVMAAIRGRDAEGARDAYAVHMTNAMEVAVRALNEQASGR